MRRAVLFSGEEGAVSVCPATANGNLLMSPSAFRKPVRACSSLLASMLVIMTASLLLGYGFDVAAADTESEPQVLIFSDIGEVEPKEPISVLALNNLGIPYEHYRAEDEYDEFVRALASHDWGLVIMEAPYSRYDWDPLIEWVADGGKLISSLWEPSSAFLRALGAERVESFDEPSRVYSWRSDHPLFTRPNSVPSPLVTQEDSRWRDNGDRLKALEGAIAYAGFSREPSPDEAATILANNERTLINGFLFDDFADIDSDGDGKDDIVEYVENQIQFLLAPPPPPPCQVHLAPNEEARGSIEERAVLPGESQYRINVPTGAKILAIALQGNGNLDLHVKAGGRVEVTGGIVTADFSLVSPDGSEFIVIRDPKPGYYCIAVENKETTPQDFALIAVPVTALDEIGPEELGQPIPGEIDLSQGLLPVLASYLRTEAGALGLIQYKVDVREGAKTLGVRLDAHGKRARLHIRYGKPVEIVEGKVAADLSVSSSTEAAVLISRNLLKPGSYYIAIEGLEPPQEFTLTVTLGETVPQAVSSEVRSTDRSAIFII